MASEDKIRVLLNELKLEMGKLDEENDLMKSLLEQQTSDAVMISTLKSDFEATAACLEIEKKENANLKEKLKRLTLEKEEFKLKKSTEMEDLTAEIQNLLGENSTLQLLNTEMAKEIKVLTMSTNQLEAIFNERTTAPESEVTLENELEDTTCAICTEEMRLKKCTPCRRRFHKSCIEKWLEENNSCPTCRAPMEE